MPLTGEGGRKKSRRFGKSRLSCLAICFLGAGLLCGCSLAREELETEEDRLAGVFLTREYLDTGAVDLKMDWRGNVSFGEESGRIPGEVRWEEGHPQIVFPGVEGYGIYEVSFQEEGSANSTGYNLVDSVFGYTEITTGNEDSMEATVYLEPGGLQSIFLNRVYQTPEGQVYLQPGQGLSSDMTVGAAMSSGVTEERTEKKNGEETKKKISFKINVVCTEADRPVSILLMGEEDNVIDRIRGERLERIFSEEDPKLQVPRETAYLIVERPETEGGTKHELCARGEEFISWLQPWGEGYLRTLYLSVDWE